MTKEEVNVVALMANRAKAGLRIFSPRDLWHWLVDRDVPEMDIEGLICTEFDYHNIVTVLQPIP